MDYTFLFSVIGALIAGGAAVWHGTKIGDLLGYLADALPKSKPVPPQPVALVAKPASLPLWLSVLWPFVQPLIGHLLDVLIAKFGLQLSSDQKAATVSEVIDNLKTGKVVNVAALVDTDLEHVASGKSAPPVGSAYAESLRIKDLLRK